jgi:ribosomal protein L17
MPADPLPADPIPADSLQGTPYAYDLAKGRLRTDRELHKLFTTLALRYRDREGGYTRIVRAGFRDYDATPMAFIE